MSAALALEGYQPHWAPDRGLLELSPDHVFQDTVCPIEQWLQRHSDAGSSWTRTPDRGPLERLASELGRVFQKMKCSSMLSMMFMPRWHRPFFVHKATRFGPIFLQFPLTRPRARSDQTKFCRDAGIPRKSPPSWISIGP